jgi:hypothetical protein
VNDELERKWKEEVTDCLKVLLQHLLGETERSYENPQTG